MRLRAPSSCPSYTHKVLLENLLRTGTAPPSPPIRSGRWVRGTRRGAERGDQFTPARVIMQDFTGVPCVVDPRHHARSRRGPGRRSGEDQPARTGRTGHRPLGDRRRLRAPGRAGAQRRPGVRRSRERYAFLRWGRRAFDEFKVVPPGTGIRHQVNIENLARVVMVRDGVAYPDTCVGTDSHTTMVNGLGVLGWGVGGIEAEAAMLGQPVSMLIPRVVGFKLHGELPAGTDRHRPGAHDHRDAAPARRGRQVRRSSSGPVSRGCRWPTAPPSAT